MKKGFKKFLPGLVLALLILFSVILQFITGSLQVSANFILPFSTTLAVVTLMIFLKRRRVSQVVIDERTNSVVAKANGMTFLMIVVLGLVASNIVSALTPYYPQLSVASATLLWVVIGAGAIRALFYLYYNRKMS